jgi:hypothetical protein
MRGINKLNGSSLHRRKMFAAQYFLPPTEKCADLNV